MAEEDTTVLPNLTPTRRIDLAWSREEFRPYCLDYYPPAESAPRTRVEVATAIWTLLALAIMYGCTSDTSYPRVMPASMAVPTAAAPSVAAVEPTEATESVLQPDVWTLPPVPAAEHLREPEPVMVPAAPDTYTDAAFIAALSRNGVSVYDPQSTVLLAHMACSELGAGRSVVSVASELKAGQNSSSRAPIDMATAMVFVAASVNYYCPQFR